MTSVFRVGMVHVGILTRLDSSVCNLPSCRCSILQIQMVTIWYFNIGRKALALHEDRPNAPGLARPFISITCFLPTTPYPPSLISLLNKVNQTIFIVRSSTFQNTERWTSAMIKVSHYSRSTNYRLCIRTVSQVSKVTRGNEYLTNLFPMQLSEEGIWI